MQFSASAAIVGQARRPRSWAARAQRLVERRRYVLFIGPTLLFVAALTLYPACSTIFISFTNIDFGLPDWRLVGLKNYQRLLDWEYLPTVLRNTGILVVLASAFQITIGFGFALALNQRWPFRRIVRGITVLPWVIPSIVIALLFQQIFNGSRIGIANAILAALGGDARVWLAEPGLALVIIVFVMVWRALPLSVIILLGGLQTIPRDLYEASEIDGASRWQKFTYVTLPLMRPILLVNLIWVTAGNLNHLDIPFGLTGGGPSHQTEVLSVSLYDQAFLLLDAGFAAAIATMMLLINITITIVYLLLLRTRR